MYFDWPGDMNTSDEIEGNTNDRFHKKNELTFLKTWEETVSNYFYGTLLYRWIQLQYI